MATLSDPKKPLTEKHIEDLLYQALETEIGGVEVYRMALLCVKNDDLKKEWTKYLSETIRHEEVVRTLFSELSLDPEATTPGRIIVRDKGQALVAAMQKALKDAPDSAEVVATECVVDAESKDHKNWSLLSALSKSLSGLHQEALTKACREVEPQEDEHLYHSMGWSRELSLQALGLPAVLPPPEEQKDVKSMGEAAKAKESRKEMVGKTPTP